MTARDTGTADQLADESAISAIYNSVLGVEKASAWRDRLAADRIDDRQCDIAARHLPQLPGMNDAARVAADVGQANLWSGGPPQTLWARRDRLQRHFERALYLRAKLCHDDQSGVAADFIEVLPGGGGKWLMIAGTTASVALLPDGRQPDGQPMTGLNARLAFLDHIARNGRVSFRCSHSRRRAGRARRGGRRLRFCENHAAGCCCVKRLRAPLGPLTAR